MYLIRAEDELEKLPKPCDVFDIIAGTSTGALIAIMLGRLVRRVWSYEGTVLIETLS